MNKLVLNDKSRIVWVDIARVVAILCVILCHVVEGVYSLNIAEVNSYSFYARIMIFSLMYIGRLGVPIFLILTGYLLLNKTYDKNSILYFWKKKCVPLLMVTEIWILIYWVFNAFLTDTFDIIKLINQLLFLRNTDVNHLWYLPMILGIYFFIPFISRAIKGISTNILLGVVGIVAVYSFIVPLINHVLLFSGNQSISSQLFLDYSGGYYGVYLIFGYILKSKNFNISRFFLIILGILSLLIATGTQYFFYTNGYELRYWYNSIYVLVGAISLILYLKRISKLPVQYFIYRLATFSFGVYLIHNMILILIYSRLTMSTLDRLLQFALLYFLTTIISFLAVGVLSKFKIINKILFSH